MTQINTDSYSQKDLDAGTRSFQNQWLLQNPTASKRQGVEGRGGGRKQGCREEETITCPCVPIFILEQHWKQRVMGCDELKLLTRTELSLIKLRYMQSISEACPGSGHSAPTAPHKGPSHSPSPRWEPSLGQEPLLVVPRPGRSWKTHRRGAQPSH